jgi:hypothetical protein
MHFVCMGSFQTTNSNYYLPIVVVVITVTVAVVDATIPMMVIVVRVIGTYAHNDLRICPLGKDSRQ